MTRSKGKPPVAKPAFDEESVLRFAAQDPDVAVDASRGPAASKPAKGPVRQKVADEPDANRLSLTLKLKADVIIRLRDEAARKEKKIDQIVEKLVIKHLGKH